MSNYQPHPYQVSAIRLMITQGAAGLLLDPGLGKTSVSLAASKILLDKKIVNGVLVIAPLRPAKLTWPAELDKWDQFRDLDMVVLHGKNKDSLLKEDHQIYVINPEGLDWLLQPTWEKKTCKLKASRMQYLMSKFNMLIVDESTKFKSNSSQRFNMLKASLNWWRRRYILTGSPSPNGLEDLWAQIYLLDGGMSLEPFITHFRRKYFYVPIGGNEKYDRLPFPGVEKTIAEKINHLVLRLKAEDYLQLPELVVNPIKVDMPLPIWSIYRELEEEFYLKLETGEVTVGTMAILSNKLRQLVAGALYIPDKSAEHLHTTKIEALVELVEELSGQPLLVGYDFVFEKEMIQEFLPQARFFTGKEREDQQLIEEFNKGLVPVLAGNPASIGHGLNLQEACCHVAYLSLTWNLENFEQFLKRVLRQGNKAARVMMHLILCRGTVDEAVWTTLQSKDFSQKSLLSHLRSSIMVSVGQVPRNTEFIS